MNSDAPLLEDLISRHFDDGTSAGENAALAQQLANNPSAALQFVRTARVHALLESIAPRRAVGRAVLLRRWIGLGAAAALVAAGAGSAILLLSKPIASSNRPQIVSETGDHRANRKPLPPGVNLRTVKNFAGATTVPPASLDELLSNFYVHADPNGLSVPEALRALEKSIGEANLLNRAELNALRFTAGPSVIPLPSTPRRPEPLPELRYDLNGNRGANGGAPEPVIASPLRSPLTINQYLDICGLYREVTLEPGPLRYGQDSPLATRDDGTLSDRVFRVTPDFLSRFRIPESIPPGSPDIRINAQQTSSRVLRERFGITLVPPEMAFFDATTAKLLVKASQSKLDRLEAMLEISVNVRPVQHYLTVKYFVCPPEVLPASFDPATGVLLSDAEAQKFMEQLSLTKGVDLATAPWVLVRAGQPAAVEILTDKPGSPPVAPRQTDWVGLRQEILTTCVGETIQVSGLIDLGLTVASGTGPFPEFIGNPAALPKTGAENVKHHMTGYDIWVPNGYTAMFTLDVDTGGRGVALACVTAQTVNPAGQ